MTDHIPDPNKKVDPATRAATRIAAKTNGLWHGKDIDAMAAIIRRETERWPDELYDFVQRHKYLPPEIQDMVLEQRKLLEDTQ